MEKFGIFELLDTLSALILPETPEKSGAPERAEKVGAPETAPNAADRAFAPPAYGEQTETAGASALSAFLDRHEKAVKHIGAGDAAGSGSGLTGAGSAGGSGSTGAGSTNGAGGKEQTP